jgi:glycosyltransferase involved in cell wall biosynthesis
MSIFQALTDSVPLVTIGIPTYNRSRFLVQAVESALAQTYPNVEIIVSDNASTDDTHNVLSAYKDRIKVLSQRENIGMARNWNACLDAASGQYFLLLSDDDSLEPTAIEKLINEFDDSVVFVYGKTAVHNPGGTIDYYPVIPPLCESGANFIMECYGNKRYSPTGATLFNTTAMKHEGGYLWHNFNLVLDTAMMMKIALFSEKRCVKFIDQIVFHYRVHSTNATNAEKISSWVLEIEGLFRIIMQKLDVSQTYRHRLNKFKDRYVIAFVIHLSTQSPAKTIKDKVALFKECYYVCKPYIGIHSLKPLLYGYGKLILPDRMVRKLRRLKNH